MANIRLNHGAAVTLDGTEQIPVVKQVGGVDTDGTATAQQIANLASGAASIGAISATVTASKAIIAADVGKFLYCEHASTPIVITAPIDAALTIPIDAEFHIRWEGLASVSVAQASGAVITKRADRSLALGGRYAVVTLKRKSATEWALFGDLQASS